jgi:hypothetical protein
VSEATANLQKERPVADEYFRPSEGDRLAKAKAWLRVARGESQQSESLFDDEGEQRG